MVISCSCMPHQRVRWHYFISMMLGHGLARTESQSCQILLLNASRRRVARTCIQHDCGHKFTFLPSALVCQQTCFSHTSNGIRHESLDSMQNLTACGLFVEREITKKVVARMGREPHPILHNGTLLEPTDSVVLTPRTSKDVDKSGLAPSS